MSEAGAAKAEDTTKLKEAFVREWLRTNDHFKAGLAIFPGDSGRAMRASWEWPQDAEVLSIRERMLADGLGSVLPNKEELARNVLNIATNERISADDKLKAYELYGRIMGMIEKPAAAKPNDDQEEKPPAFIIAPDNVPPANV